MGPRAGVDRCGKSRPPPGFDPRTVQPVASRYTDYVTRPAEIDESSYKKQWVSNPLPAMLYYAARGQDVHYVRVYTVKLQLN